MFFHQIKRNNALCAYKLVLVNREYLFLCVCGLEICTGLGPVCTVPCRQMRDDFSNGPGRQMTVIFPAGRAGPAKKKWVLKRPSQATKKSKAKNIEHQSKPINLLLIIIITECLSQSASVCSFHNSDLLKPSVIDIQCLH